MPPWYFGVASGASRFFLDAAMCGAHYVSTMPNEPRPNDEQCAAVAEEVESINYTLKKLRPLGIDAPAIRALVVALEAARREVVRYLEHHERCVEHQGEDARHGCYFCAEEARDEDDAKREAAWEARQEMLREEAL